MNPIIKKFEGFSDKPYHCPSGYKTIGYGHRCWEGENFKIPLSLEDGEMLLEKDLEGVQRALRKYVLVQLESCQIMALESFIYNVGVAAFERSTLRRRINRAEHEYAASEFKRWIWGGGMKLPGLVRRRFFESEIYLGNFVSLSQV